MVPGRLGVANGGILTAMNLSLYRGARFPSCRRARVTRVGTVKVGHRWDLAESVGAPGAWVARDRKLLQVRAYPACDRVTGSKAQRGTTSNLPSRLGRWATGSGFRNLEPTFAL